MESIISQRKKWSDRRAEFEADLAEKRKDLPAAPRQPEDQAAWDFAPCIAAHWTSQVNELMLDGCRTFVDEHAKDTAADPDNLSTARYDVIRALASLGRFAEARPLAETLLADSNDWDEELQALMREWPED